MTSSRHFMSSEVRGVQLNKVCTLKSSQSLTYLVCTRPRCHTTFWGRFLGLLPCNQVSKATDDTREQAASNLRN